MLTIGPVIVGPSKANFLQQTIEIDHNLKTKKDVYEKLACWNDYQIIYTDGSKCGEGVSAAYYHIHKKYARGFRLPTIYTVFSAEATAIMEALKYITNDVMCSSALSFISVPDMHVCFEGLETSRF